MWFSRNDLSIAGLGGTIKGKFTTNIEVMNFYFNVKACYDENYLL